MIKQNKRLITILAVCAAILLVPLLVMQFSSEVQWSLTDFAIAGILLFGGGLLLELILRKTQPSTYQKIAICALIVLLILIIVELGVGLFGTPLAGD